MMSTGSSGGSGRGSRRRRSSGTFPLNITSLIDMLTIILVFLLKSYNTSAVEITPSKGMRLPASTSETAPIEALKLNVSKEGIFVDEKLIVPLTNGSIDSSLLEKNDPKFIKTLYQALDEQAKKTQAIAKENETVQFDGKLVFQADQDLPYEVLKKVMYTASVAGYADFKFAVIKKE